MLKLYILIYSQVFQLKIPFRHTNEHAIYLFICLKWALITHHVRVVKSHLLCTSNFFYNQFYIFVMRFFPWPISNFQFKHISIWDHLISSYPNNFCNFYFQVEKNHWIYERHKLLSSNSLSPWNFSNLFFLALIEKLLNAEKRNSLGIFCKFNTFMRYNLGQQAWRFSIQQVHGISYWHNPTIYSLNSWNLYSWIE